MLIPIVAYTVIFCYIPMFGIVMAFQKYIPLKGVLGSEWIGLQNFRYIFRMPEIFKVTRNTVVIAFWKIIFGNFAPVFIAILLNEIYSVRYRRTIQTLIYLPHFISWAILGGIFIDLFSLDGPVNALMEFLGQNRVMFLADNNWFRTVIVSTDIWKGFGFGTIIYLASITGINPALYESAVIDGANRFRQTWHITLPGMSGIIILVWVMSLSGILNAGFEQIFTMYNPIVYETGDIIDTLVYRVGIVNNQWSFGTAVGLAKSLVSALLVGTSYYFAYKFSNYRIF